MLAILLPVYDKRPRSRYQIVKANKTLNLTTKPMKFSTLHKKLEGKVEWLEPLLSNCKGLDAEYGAVSVSLHTVTMTRNLQKFGASQKVIYEVTP